jgi:hypothetical protein
VSRYRLAPFACPLAWSPDLQKPCTPAVRLDAMPANDYWSFPVGSVVCAQTRRSLRHLRRTDMSGEVNRAPVACPLALTLPLARVLLSSFPLPAKDGANKDCVGSGLGGGL